MIINPYSSDEKPLTYLCARFSEASKPAPIKELGKLVHVHFGLPS